MGFRANIAKKRGLVVPKCVYCISSSQGRWTLGFCMEAIKSLKSLYQHMVGLKQKKNIFKI